MAYTGALQASLNEVEKSLDNRLKAVEAGIFNDTTKTRMDELDNQKQILAAIERTKLHSGMERTKDHIPFSCSNSARKGEFLSTIV